MTWLTPSLPRCCCSLNQRYFFDGAPLASSAPSAAAVEFIAWTRLTRCLTSNFVETAATVSEWRARHSSLSKDSRVQCTAWKARIVLKFFAESCKTASVLSTQDHGTGFVRPP